MTSIKEAQAEFSNAIDSAIVEYNRRDMDIGYKYDVSSIGERRYQEMHSLLLKERDEKILEAAAKLMLKISCAGTC